ncbi:MAG TPA: chemotaxis protein CheW [Candidatus Sulfotelmatobacter sp.]|jgi:purine-binding chemotaxis protein CheW
MMTMKIDANLTLTIRVGARICAVPLSDVVEIMRPLPVEPWTGPTDVVQGLSVIRGAPVPVVDLGRLLGASDKSLSTRLVAIRVGARRVALAVDSVLGIREFAPVLRSQMPPLLLDTRTDLVEAVGALDTELFTVLKTCRIVPAKVWEALPRQEA